MGGAWKYVYAVAFIWFTIGAAIVSLRYGKWVPTLGAWARGAVLTFFVASVAIFAARHGVHGFGGHAFLPSYAVFIAVVPVLFFNYAGLEVPTAAGEEMTNPRRVGLAGHLFVRLILGGYGREIVTECISLTTQREKMQVNAYSQFARERLL